MGELLRVLLPLGVVSAARSHQYLLVAVDSEEVPGRDETGPPPIGRRPRAAPDVLRSLDLGDPGGGEDQNDKSRMTGDCHVRFRGSPGVRFPRATRLLAFAPEVRRVSQASRLRALEAEGLLHPRADAVSAELF